METGSQEPRGGSWAGPWAGGAACGERGTDPGTPIDNGEHWWTPSVPFTILHFQVILLDFGSSRAFGTEFTDHYIEVSSPNPGVSEGSSLKPYSKACREGETEYLE